MPSIILDSLKRKELGIFEILLKSFRVFLGAFPIILIISLIIDLPFCLIIELLLPTFDEPIAGQFWAEYQGGNIVYILTMPAKIGVIIYVERYLKSERIGIQALLRSGFSKWGSFLGTSWIAGLGIFLRLFLLIFPGIIYAVKISFIDQLVSARGIVGDDAISYSKSLVQGRFWKVFSLFALIFINNFILVSIFVEIFGSLSLLWPSNAFVFGVSVRFINELILFHFASVFGTLLFLNLDFCKE